MEENVIQINGGMTINVDVSVKNVMYAKKIMFGILLHVIVSMKKYLTSIMDNSAIICDEVTESYYEETKTVPTDFNETNITCKTQNFYTLFAFLLIITGLLAAVSIYCYLIKYRAKPKHLLREVLY